ncbi:MAG TPA: monooxygenase [Cytophagales bacterium]|nr:monooxygenase [Cytophagales bacterium]HAA21222.1 monooxygenase [Cytophagales bacterium]
MRELIIVGGGIGGLALAAGLKNRGMHVQVLEAAPELKPVGAGILLANNAQKALDHIGILSNIVPLGQSLREGAILNQKGNTLGKQLTLEDARPWLGIHRGALQQGLLGPLEENQVVLGRRVVNVKVETDRVVLTTEQGETHEAQHIIAFDGIHSPFREAVGDTRSIRYSGYTCWRGLAEGWDGPKEYFSETWGKGKRFGIVPIQDRTYWFATANAPHRDPKMKAMDGAALKTVFADFHQEVFELLDLTPKVIWNDIEDIAPVKKLVYGRILLAGDAGHATTPNMGQGACMALEDAATLTSLLTKNLNWDEVGRRFEQKRLRRTAWITKQSWQLGKMAQWAHPLAASFRNSMTKMTPDSLSQGLLRKLANVTFEA